MTGIYTVISKQKATKLFSAVMIGRDFMTIAINDMNNQYFIKFIEHSPEFYYLIGKRPTALLLLMLLVDRARKVELTITDGLHVGDAMTGRGDHKKYGVSEEVYRNDLVLLKKLSLIATGRATSKGTIVKIVNSSIFNIDRDQSTSNGTSKPPASHQQATTKQEDKKKESKQAGIAGKSFSSLEEAWSVCASPYLKSIRISDPVFIREARLAFLSKAKQPTQKAVEAFIGTQRKRTPPDMADYMTGVWPEGVGSE